MTAAPVWPAPGVFTAPPWVVPPLLGVTSRAAAAHHQWAPYAWPAPPPWGISWAGHAPPLDYVTPSLGDEWGADAVDEEDAEEGSGSEYEMQLSDEWAARFAATELRREQSALHTACPESHAPPCLLTTTRLGVPQGSWRRSAVPRLRKRRSGARLGQRTPTRPQPRWRAQPSRWQVRSAPRWCLPPLAPVWCLSVLLDPFPHSLRHRRRRHRDDNSHRRSGFSDWMRNRTLWHPGDPTSQAQSALRL